MSYLKDLLAESWAAYLCEETLLPVYPNRREARSELPFTVVVVKRLEPLVPGVNTHYADVRIVHVSDVADSTTAEHNARVRALHAAIEGTPRPARDAVRGVDLLGYCITDIEEVSGTGDDGRKVRSDVFIIEAGVSGAF